MRQAVCAILVALTLGLSGPSGEAAAQTVVIRDDGGGKVDDYRIRRAELARADQVRIMGKCLSACTIFTTLPNACVMPRAQIGFHGVSKKTGIAAYDHYRDMRMGEFYRGEVRRRYEANWRHLEGRDQFHVISGRRLKELDPKIRLCKG